VGPSTNWIDPNRGFKLAPLSLLFFGSSTHLADNVLRGANSVTVAIYLAPTSAGDPERDMHRPGLYHLALYDR
jgi:hypothetical protein